MINVWCFTVILPSWSPYKCITFFQRWKGSVQCKFGGCCVGGSVPLWKSSSSAVLAESRLSRGWAMEHSVYALCDHRRGSSKTSSQYSSSIATTSHRNSLLSIISSDKTCIQQVSPLAHRFQSLSLLHGCAVCTENVIFSSHLPSSYCPHKQHTFETRKRLRWSSG